MARINLLGQGVRGRSPYVTAQERRNLYADVLPGIGDKAQVVLYGMPGHRPFVRQGTAPALLLRYDVARDVAYMTTAEPGASLYSYGTPNPWAPPVALGSLVDSSTSLLGATGALCPSTGEFLACGYAATGQRLRSYLPGSGLAETGPADVLASCVEYAGGRFVCNDTANPGRFWWSDVTDAGADGRSWDALAFATDFDVGEIVRILWRKDTMIVFGTRATTFYSVTTDPNAPFSRIVGTLGEFGLAEPLSLAAAGEDVFFLAQIAGGRFFARLNGYVAEPITQPDLAFHVDAYPGGMARSHVYRASAYQYLGHTCYHVRLSGESFDRVWDGTAGTWCESDAGIASTVAMSLGSGPSQSLGLVAGLADGNIVELRPDWHTYRQGDTDAAITRRAILPHVYDGDGLNNVVLRQVRLDVDPNGPAPTLSVSRDGGASYGSALAGTRNGAGTMLQWNQLGIARDFTMKFEATGRSGPVVWISAYAELLGASK